MEDIVGKWIDADDKTQIYMELVGTDLSKMKKFHTILARRLKEAKLKRYIYLLTFTLDVKKCEQYELAEEYIKGQVKRSALKIKQFHYVKEFHKSGVPHFHVAIETLKPLKKDRFNYYIKKFGNLDISRTKAQTIQEALNYISKDNVPIKLI